MKRLVLLTLLTLSSPAFAQQASPTSYTFIMTPEEANVMFGQLGKLDWVTVNPVMQKLISQLQAQNRAAAAPVGPVPVPTPPAAPPKE